MISRRLAILSCAVFSFPAMARTESAVDAEVAAVSARIKEEFGPRYLRTPDEDVQWIARTKSAVIAAGRGISMPALLVAVDRNPLVQRMNIIMARQDAEWNVLGGSVVSTGKPGTKDHFLTPLGVFVNSSDILGYRARGTKNSNGIRGIGTAGMRVWDFGWQDADSGNGRINPGGMRLNMHGTDPVYLEPRLGKPASEGCVRLPFQVVNFLDKYGIIDRDYEEAALTQRRFAALLKSDRNPSPYAGNALVVFDSSPRRG